MPCCAKKQPAEDFIDLESSKEIKKSKMLFMQLIFGCINIDLHLRINKLLKITFG